MKLSILAISVVATLALAAGCGGQAEAEEKPKVADDALRVGPKAPEPVAAETPVVAPSAEQPAKPAAAKAPMAFDEKPAVGTKAFCPVMKNEFVISKSSDRSEFEGKHYAFCCPGCKPQFDADPKKFIDG